jgi:tetratricopeptide (TPR) repeat protein
MPTTRLIVGRRRGKLATGMRLRLFVIAPLALAAILHGQEPLNRPVPLSAAPVGPSPGSRALSLEAAQRAQGLGFPALAAVLDRALLAERGGNRRELTLDLATALLDGGHPDQAEQVLRGWPGPRGSAWHLRAGLAAAAQGKFDAAHAELAAAREGELTAADRAWFLYLRGRVAKAEGDLPAAGNSYRQALQAATTDLARARFVLADEEAQLSAGAVSPEMAESARKNAEGFRGTATGHDFARSYAIILDGLGRKAEAVAVLQRELLTFQPSERDRADNCRLLLGLIDGAGDGVGRQALLQLLESGADADRQRIALQLLGAASTAGPARSGFRAELDQLIAAPTPHPIDEDLLLFRAAWALGDQPPDYRQADADAQALLDQFPGSSLKSYAWGLLTASAWEQHRYRIAATDAAREQAESPAGDARAELGVLTAEAWFRAGTLAGDAVDFRSAAAAYAAALRDRPAQVPAGDLMFQRVESEIEAGALQAPPDETPAQKTLDRLAADPAFDQGWRWRAEFNLAQMLRLGGQTQAAYARVTRLLAATPAAAALPAELRARMAWLQAQLSFDAHEYVRTLELVAALRRSPRDGLSSDLHSNIAGTSALLEAQADFQLDREAAGLAVLERLRADFPPADATVPSYLVASYLVEADYHAQHDQLSIAQRLLIQLAERFPDSVYAPDAYFQAALLAERLGQPKDLRQANDLIEKMIALVGKYPANDPRHDLVFAARLKQGDLLRKLNEFPQAQRTYELLRTDYPRHKDIVYALLALAACHAAQSANDPGQAESAKAILEDVSDRVDAPVDVRVEAGYELGLRWQAEADDAHAEAVWWTQVVTPFLLNPARAAQLGAGGRGWMAKTLLDLGSLYARQGRLEQAKRAWRLVLESRLPFPLVAESDLAGLDAPAARP